MFVRVLDPVCDLLACKQSIKQVIQGADHHMYCLCWVSKDSGFLCKASPGRTWQIRGICIWCDVVRLMSDKASVVMGSPQSGLVCFMGKLWFFLPHSGISASSLCAVLVFFTQHSMHQ